MNDANLCDLFRILDRGVEAIEECAKQLQRIGNQGRDDDPQPSSALKKERAMVADRQARWERERRERPQSLGERQQAIVDAKRRPPGPEAIDPLTGETYPTWLDRS